VKSKQQTADSKQQDKEVAAKNAGWSGRRCRIYCLLFAISALRLLSVAFATVARLSLTVTRGWSLLTVWLAMSLRLRLWLRLCCALLRLRAWHIHATLRLAPHRYVLSRPRRWWLRNLRLRHVLTSLGLTCTRHILPSRWRCLLRLLTMSYRFTPSLLNRVTLCALLLDLL